MQLLHGLFVCLFVCFFAIFLITRLSYFDLLYRFFFSLIQEILTEGNQKTRSRLFRCRLVPRLCYSKIEGKASEIALRKQIERYRALISN